MQLRLMTAIVTTVAGITAVHAQTTSGTNAPSDPAKSPKIVFAATSFDFGEVESGTAVKHEFWFTNTGQALLEVKDVRPGCGCTTAGEWDKQVAPGASGKIPVQFNSAGYGGAVSKAIFVTCNDPQQSTVTLQLHGTIWKSIDVKPPYVIFNILPDAETNQTQIVRITSNLKEPITLSDPSSSSPAFKLELKTVTPGKEFDLLVTILASQVTGNVSTPIQIKTSSPKYPTVSLSAFGTPQPLIAISPSQLSLPQGPLGQDLQLGLTIQNNGTNNLVLSDPAFSVPGVNVKVVDIQPGKQFHVAAQFPKGFSSPTQQMELTIKSSHPKYPVLKVPVIQPAAAATVTPAPPAGSPAQNPNAQKAAEKKQSGPQISFTEWSFDFGRVQSGKIVNHEFTFTNSGNEALVISDVVSSCGCTAADNYSKRVEPGATGKLPVIFNTTGMAGPARKTLTIPSNDRLNPKVLVEITATLWKPIDAIPAVAAFSFGPDSQRKDTRVLRLINNLDTPVTLSAPVCTNGSFKAEMSTIRPGQEFELRVSVVPPLPPGSSLCPITIQTSSPKMPVVTVDAYALVQPAITLMPQRVTVREVPLAEATPFTVTIQNRSTNALALSKPTVINAPGAELKLAEVQPGRVFRAILTLPAGFNPKPDQEIEVRLQSSNPQMPVVKIPVAVFRPDDSGPSANGAQAATGVNAGRAVALQK
jgi:Protein of unknown function (DUF1573)